MNIEDDGLFPLVKFAVQHYQFESFPPFYDGDERKGGILNVFYLSQFIIEHNADYYHLQQEFRTKESWEEWVLFIVHGVVN